MFQERSTIRQWLELQIKFTELGVIIEALHSEIKNLESNTYSSSLEVLSLQEEETERLHNEIVSVDNVFYLLMIVSSLCIGML
jgi:hypothetical protein